MEVAKTASVSATGSARKTPRSGAGTKFGMMKINGIKRMTFRHNVKKIALFGWSSATKEY